MLHSRETNLKVRQALPETAVMGEDINKLKQFTGKSFLFCELCVGLCINKYEYC